MSQGSPQDEDVFAVPSEIEAEEAALGSLLIDPEAIHDVSYFLKADHFYRITNGWIFEAILELSETGTPVDLVTLSSNLTAKEQLKEIGGEAYIVGLINAVPTSINIEAYAKLITNAAKKRALINAAREITTLAFDGEISASDAIAQSEEALFDVALAERDGKATRHIGDVAREHIDKMERLSQEGVSDMIPTGFMDLDKLLGGGFEQGALVLVAADTSMGKSSFVRQIMFNAAKEGHSGAMFTLEMPAIQYFQRQVASDTRIPVSRMKAGGMADSEWPTYYQHVGELSTLPMDLDDTRLTTSQLLSKCRRIKMKRGLKIAAVDLMHQMDVEEPYHNETQRLAVLSRRCKQIAMELKIVLIIVLQLNTKQIAQRQDNRPTIADVRNSSDPNGDSDTIILIYRDEYYNPDTSERPNIAEITVAKNRDQTTGTADLYWHGQLMSFRNLQRREITL